MQDQNIDLQADSLKQAGCERIFSDQITGTKGKRPGLERALNMLRKGDVLVVWRLDRLGRSLRHLIDSVTMLEERKIGFKSLQENIDTSTSGGRLIFHIFGALAEFERSVIRERTMAGLSAARARGRMGGRPKALEPDKRELALKLYKENVHTVKRICKIMGISKTSLYRYVREEKAKN